MPAINKRVGFIGAGQMAEALARGFAARGVVATAAMTATDPNPERKAVFQSFGVKVVDSNSEVVQGSDIVIIAVKPQYVAVVLAEVRPVLAESTVVVSIAAGVTVANMLEAAGAGARIVRVMPNTPCLVGETAAAMCLGGAATEGDAADVRALFAAVGVIHRVDERLLSAVTGLSGSGPAYIFLAIEALADGGVRAGLPRDVSLALAAQTVAGAARMVLDTGKHPGALKDMVTSPAGTTIAGVHELERAGVRAAFMNAVVAASARADELARGGAF